MKRFCKLGRAASRQLDEIAVYSRQKFGNTSTRIYLEDFEQKFDLLAASPEIGVMRDEIFPNLRSFPCGSHVIFYDYDEKYLYVAAILHHAMDVVSFFES